MDVCQSCRQPVDIAHLDAKPARLARRWYSWAIPARLRLWQLRRAADTGVDFDRLECADCYGPGYASR